MLAALDSYELTEWLAFWEIEHLDGPDDRADLRAGIIASTIANAHRNPDTTPEPFAPFDFVPRFADQEEKWDGSAVAMSPEAFSELMHARFPQAG